MRLYEALMRRDAQRRRIERLERQVERLTRERDDALRDVVRLTADLATEHAMCELRTQQAHRLALKLPQRPRFGELPSNARRRLGPRGDASEAAP